ncbi:putative toxin-antitoxin system toxin component, PIN family [Thermosynechococcaceae cyanobacterium BACA0444]|uniref:Toxin-antitoxin system toxin component, PIN family n=1 Tax=Pseudocalidococcus azoricus BACA0444 TaxID=2918990 RepID=A0AAE4FNG2_9CYAN|nr:putative toxin-antitoxin system toxin component, PIN family [Pseudocalidococcus azoricus]MDS3859201.1 putative toxin-antitoxin system toxin component, PIN family [Pseudocalidococcus azoricus BACA0444]
MLSPIPIPQIVIDTNVVIAGLRSRNGSAFRLLSLVGSEQFKINLSVPLVLEYEEVLLRELPNLTINLADIQDFLNFHCSVASHHQIFFLWRPFLPDPKDDMVLELAVKAGCDSVVTYNIRDFVGIEQFGIRAVTPTNFLESIGALP